MANTSTGQPATETSMARAAGATLKPGGAHGAPVDVGMTELHGQDVPSHALDLVEHRDAVQSATDRATGKE